MIAEKSEYKAVVFDLFTTLTSLSHLKDAPGRNSHEILNVPRGAWYDALFDLSRDRLVGRITDPVEIIRDVARKIDPAVSEHRIRETADERRIRFAWCLAHPPAGVVASLRAIRKEGFRTALISNADVIEAEGWPGTELASCFDTAVFSCDVGYMKPDPEIFRICLDRLNLPANACLYVGDGGNQELPAAAEAGMTSVLTSQFLKDIWPEKVKEREKTVRHHIRDLNEILPLLDRLSGKPAV